MAKQQTMFSFLTKKRPLEESEAESSSASINSINCDNENESKVASSKIKTSIARNIKYQRHWETKYEWLYYDNSRGGAFCKLCEIHLKNDLSVFQKTSGIFITVPFQNFRKATGVSGKLEKHHKSDKHCKALAMEHARLQTLNTPIHTQLVNQSNSEKSNNRQALSALVRSVYFLAKEEIAHTTKYEPLVRRILIKHCKTFEEWINTQSERSTYLSKLTASELFSSIGEVLDKEDEKILCNKYYSLMADESTNISNQSELSLLVRYVSSGNSPSQMYEIKERFLCIMKLERTDAESIFLAIRDALEKRKLSYEKLISCSFDVAANFSGNVKGVRARISELKHYEVPHVHCRAHILSLSVTSSRNECPMIKRALHIIKDIYKLFHCSPRRENILHKIQNALQEPVLKIPEATDIRWLSTYRTVNAVLLCFKSIMMTCEHIHKDGTDLASLAGGILLEMRKVSFIVSLAVLDETLSAVTNLSKVLQKESLKLSSLPQLVSSTIDHLEAIVKSCVSNCDNADTELYRKIKKLEDDVSELKNVNFCDTKVDHFKSARKFVGKMIIEMKQRFNDKAIKLIQLCAYFENFKQFVELSENQCEELCHMFGINEIDAALSDLNSFRYVARNKIEDTSTDVASFILRADIGYETLTKIAECVLCIPISTASVERSFSSMNRIMTDLRNRMGQKTLQSCMKISIEGDEEPSDEFVDQVINCYASKKPRRVRLM